MESMVITPKDESAMAALRSFLKGMQGSFTSRAASETLEGKITRLYEEGHYSEEDIKWFFEIPKNHRTDPFEASPSGDVYWADKRNVAELDSRLEDSKKAMENGELVELDMSSPEVFWENVRSYGRDV